MPLLDILMAKTKKLKRRDVREMKSYQKPQEPKKIPSQRKKPITKLQTHVRPDEKAEFGALPKSRPNQQNALNGSRNRQNQGTTTQNPPTPKNYHYVAKNKNQPRINVPKTTQSPNHLKQNNRNGHNNGRLGFQNPKNSKVTASSEAPEIDHLTSTKITPLTDNEKHVEGIFLEKMATYASNPSTSQFITTGSPEIGTFYSGIGTVFEHTWKNHPAVLIGGPALVLFLCFMGCFCFSWRWIKNSGICRWIRRKLSRKEKSRSRTPPPQRQTRNEERQRLLNNQSPARVPDQNPSYLDGVAASLASERIRQNNEPKSTWEKSVEQDLQDFKDSLTATTEEAMKLAGRKEKLRKLEQETKEAKIKMDKMKEKHESASSSVAGNFDELDKMDQEFRAKLAEMNRQYAEKLRAMREERARKEKEAAEELNRMRYESQQTIAAILACIKLRIRFDEKREEWGDSLKKLRQPLITIQNSYYNFRDDIKNLDPTDDFEMSCFQTDGTRFAKKLEDAQNMLFVAFNNLDQLSENFEDRIFIRIIMKSCSEQGQVCDAIGYKLVELLKSPNPTDNLCYLEKEVDELKPHNIPTTETLMKRAPLAKEDDYRVIETVPAPDWINNLN